jgi:Zn-dependent M32 family carboxypeptidase
MNPIEELKMEFTEITRLNYIRALLGWDEQVNLPHGSFEGRGSRIV